MLDISSVSIRNSGIPQAQPLAVERGGPHVLLSAATARKSVELAQERQATSFTCIINTLQLCDGDKHTCATDYNPGCISIPWGPPFDDKQTRQRQTPVVLQSSMAWHVRRNMFALRVIIKVNVRLRRTPPTDMRT